MDDAFRDSSPEPEANAPTDRFPCPQCGSVLRFDPAAQGLSCNHCGWTRAAADASPWARLQELDYQAALRESTSKTETEETRILSCDSCGAATRLDPLLQASECPFCAAPLVDAAGAKRQIAPQGVLPFAISDREARAALQKWIESRWFAPSDLTERARSGRPLSGVYLPFWTFDADTSSSYDGQRGTAYYVTRTVTVNGKRQTRRVRKIRWRNVSGRVARAFDDVLVLASRGLPSRLTRRMRRQDWDLAALEPYRADFLAGFRAEVYAVDLEGGYTAACTEMDKVIRQDVRRDIGGDAQRISAVRTDRRDVTFKHVLLPVWIAAYRYQGKPYRLVINGRTGAIAGERPYSWMKITLAALGAAAVIGGVIWALNEAGLLQ